MNNARCRALQLATQAGVNAKLDVSAGKDAPTCTVPGLKMVNQIIPGVQETGPYIMGFTDDDEPAKSIPKVTPIEENHCICLAI